MAAQLDPLPPMYNSADGPDTHVGSGTSVDLDTRFASNFSFETADSASSAPSYTGAFGSGPFPPNQVFPYGNLGGYYGPPYQ